MAARSYVIPADGAHAVSTSGNPLLTEAGLPTFDESGETITTEWAYRSRRLTVPAEVRTLEVPSSGR